MRKLLNLSLIFLAVILFTNCDKDESLDLSRIEAKVSPKFSTDNQRVFIGNSIQFTNETLNGKTFEWTFEGGEPATSTEENPVVKYANAGTFNVNLLVTNEFGEGEKIEESYITIYETAGWEDFQFPNIHFTNKTIDENGSLYASLIPNEQDFIKKVCLQVCVELFKSSEEVNSITDITYTIEDSQTLSAKGGTPPHINISFSSSYLMQKKNEGLSDEDLIKEIEGVLVHEITHGYQYEPKGAGGYEQGTDFFGFIEGIADYVRYVEGFTSTSRRQSGGNWNDGYNTSAFFIDWLHSKDIDFAYKFNQSVNFVTPWSWDTAIKRVLGNEASVSALWDEYQSDLSSGKITQIDAELKDLRDNRTTFEYPSDSGEVVDITEKGCTATRDEAYDSPEAEAVGNLIDNDFGSKFLIFTNNTWVQLDCQKLDVVQAYTLTSGNDAPGRDPKNWKLLGSNDGSTWVELDARTDEAFTGRNQTRQFEFENTNGYKSYKFEFENTDGDIFQLSEIELFNGIPVVEEEEEGEVDITEKLISSAVQSEDFDFFDWGAPTLAYDNNPGSSFFNMNDNTWFVFETEKKYNVNRLSISATANLFGIDFVFTPDEFVLLGSNDGQNWTEITAVTETGIIAFEERKEFAFENSEYYKFHKITMSAEIEEGDNKRIMIGEMELFGTAE
ncbi:PKD domain-containing protein [Ancylomarina euxinus]|uniref:PKD domain-containing protein n=1 Tax=Ancylomarina euxinus TaxID=2283627 RepID=A0A425XXK7_9BACT|nr:basic secretory protein-like protein [Ancylomarina euxinus]MCZ4694717.1 basic secretory protein-like protein [Ancylomarina euxinus]MUP16381.1 PKD domain-containing protein [Ancylomarina euxinus]RRG19412.1 PKD domain-containing protein [Ancylomarina euxinus]